MKINYYTIQPSEYFSGESLYFCSRSKMSRKKNRQQSNFTREGYQEKRETKGYIVQEKNYFKIGFAS